jgi:hypothetical protein
MTVLATGSSSTMTPILALLGLLLLGALLAASTAVTVMRIRRGQRPREQQMAFLAGKLDGRNRFTIRKVELRLDGADLLWVANSRGYGLIDHQFGKYYEFVFAPNQVQPGRPGPWAI